MTILANTITQEIKSKLTALAGHCHDVMTLGTFGTAKELLDGINARLDEQVAENNRFIDAQREQENLLHRNVDDLIAKNAELASLLPPTKPEVAILEFSSSASMEIRAAELMARGFTFQTSIEFKDLKYRAVMTFYPKPVEPPRPISRTTMGTLPKKEDDKPTGWQNRSNGIGVYVDGEWQLQYKRCIDITAYWQLLADPAIKLLNSHRYPLVQWGYNAVTFGPFINGEIEAENPNSFGRPSPIDSKMWDSFCKWLISALNDRKLNPLDARYSGAFAPEWGRDTDWIGVSDYAGNVKRVFRRCFVDHDLWAKVSELLVVQLNQIWAARPVSRKYVWTADKHDIRARDLTSNRVLVLVEKPVWLALEDWKKLVEEILYKLNKLENKEL